MNVFEIVAETRDDLGKGASRRLRHAGKVPAVVYGSGKDPVSITVDQNEMVKHLDHEAFYSHILSLNLNGQIEQVVLKDLQRHPYKVTILHMDLLRVDQNTKLQMHIPLHYLNEEACVGVKLGGGTINHVLTELDIQCLPADLPEYIEVDVADLELGEAIHLGDLKLPEGVESVALAHGGEATQPVVTVHKMRAIVEEDDLVTEEGEDTADEADTEEGEE